MIAIHAHVAVATIVVAMAAVAKQKAQMNLTHRLLIMMYLIGGFIEIEVQKKAGRIHRSLTHTHTNQTLNPTLSLFLSFLVVCVSVCDALRSVDFALRSDVLILSHLSLSHAHPHFTSMIKICSVKIPLISRNWISVFHLKSEPWSMSHLIYHHFALEFLVSFFISLEFHAKFCSSFQLSSHLFCSFLRFVLNSFIHHKSLVKEHSLKHSKSIKWLLSFQTFTRNFRLESPSHSTITDGKLCQLF